MFKISFEIGMSIQLRWWWVPNRLGRYAIPLTSGNLKGREPGERNIYSPMVDQGVPHVLLSGDFDAVNNDRERMLLASDQIYIFNVCRRGGGGRGGEMLDKATCPPRLL